MEPAQLLTWIGIGLRVLQSGTFSGLNLAMYDSRLNSAQAQDVASEVRRWRMQRAMYIPAFPQGEIEKLRGTLDYPPKGSPEGAALEESGRTVPTADEGGTEPLANRLRDG